HLHSFPTRRSSDLPGRDEYGELTTPDPISLHKLLSELAAAGVTHGAMEASSHGLSQRRLDGVELAAGAFTNLGRDHMDYHPTVEEYHQTKIRLFDTLLPSRTMRGLRPPSTQCAMLAGSF